MAYPMRHPEMPKFFEIELAGYGRAYGQRRVVCVFVSDADHPTVALTEVEHAPKHGGDLA